MYGGNTLDYFRPNEQIEVVAYCSWCESEIHETEDYYKIDISAKWEIYCEDCYKDSLHTYDADECKKCTGCEAENIAEGLEVESEIYCETCQKDKVKEIDT